MKTIVNCSKCGNPLTEDKKRAFCHIGGEPICLTPECSRTVDCHAYGYGGCYQGYILCKSEECLKIYQEGGRKYCPKCSMPVDYHNLTGKRCPQPVENPVSSVDSNGLDKSYNSRTKCGRCSKPVCVHQKFGLCVAVVNTRGFKSDGTCGRKLCCSCMVSYRCTEHK